MKAKADTLASAHELFQALAHPVRLRLLLELCRGEICVCRLAEILERPQPYVSQQLKALRNAGLVLDRREGQRIHYRIVDQRVCAVLSAAGLVDRAHCQERCCRQAQGCT
jgi:ArsR family transcriptional regulator, arsenate/arsenite/antimonite-responsive transcriptional repressor